MPLTKEERAFLDAYVVEATAGPPFGGPATSDLARRGIFYSDLHWLLTTWDRERCAARRGYPEARNPNPPPSPWESLERVRERGRALKEELESRSSPTTVSERLERSAG
jgi:hypothetical protein